MTVDEYRQKEIQKCKEEKKYIDIVDDDFNCEEYEVPKYIAKHIEKFGIPPVFDFKDICWDGDLKEIEKAVLESVNKNIPFVVYDWLTKS